MTGSPCLLTRRTSRLARAAGAPRIERAPAGAAPTGLTKPAEIAACESAPVIEAWECDRFAPEEDPAWLRLVLNWRAAPWSAIATSIVLSAGVLLVAARSLGGDGTPAATEITDASLSGEVRTAAPPPVLLHSVAVRASSAHSCSHAGGSKSRNDDEGGAAAFLCAANAGREASGDSRHDSDANSSCDFESGVGFAAGPVTDDSADRHHFQSRDRARGFHPAARAFATQRLGIDSVATGSLPTGVWRAGRRRRRRSLAGGQHPLARACLQPTGIPAIRVRRVPD